MLIDIAKLREKQVIKKTTSQNISYHTAMCSFHHECFIQEMFSSVAGSLALSCAVPKYKVGLIFTGAYSS